MLFRRFMKLLIFFEKNMFFSLALNFINRPESPVSFKMLMKIGASYFSRIVVLSYIYIYIYIYRERERDENRERIYIC
jgi:hypothetical protein